MLSDDDYAQFCKKLGLSNQAKLIVGEIRSTPPSRRVCSAAGNVSVRYPSRKMGVIIQAESHRNELAGIYEKEYDSSTLEYYDQPPPIKLVYKSKSGRKVGVWHTPDYFVLKMDSVGWEEWKTEDELVQLSEKMPYRYVRQDKRWICPPGEHYAKQFGLFYHIRSSAEIDWIFQRNVVFLEDYLRSDDSCVSKKSAQTLCSIVKEDPGIRLKKLIQCNDSDDVYTMIATGNLYVDMHATPLIESERVQVFLNKEIAMAYSHITTPSLIDQSYVYAAIGSTINWDGRQWMISNLGQTMTTLLTTGGELMELPNTTFESLVKQGKISNTKNPFSINSKGQEIFSKASPSALEEANRRYAIIAPYLKGKEQSESTVSGRTLRRWLKKWRDAQDIYGCGYVGLIPKQHNKGNSKRKLPDSTIAILEEFITKDYQTLKQKRKFEVYGALLLSCEERGVIAPSYKTFVKAVNQKPIWEQTMKRKGKRAAYAHEPFYRELTLTTPRHGDRPFEIGHIDHTQLDIELVCSSSGYNLGRPWATFLSDAFSRRLLAVYLTFDSPSYRSCMMILRECVRRYSRLPQIVVVDGGKEFESTYFETLLARYECSKKTRPSSKSRFGSVCERLFGTTNTRFIYNLTGNTQIMRDVRQVTKSVNPKKHACWTLGRLYARLKEWAYEVYDSIEHPALHKSPRETFNNGLKESGKRPHRLIPYNDDFRIFTLPTTQKGVAKVIPKVGVKIKYIYYWADIFLEPEVENERIPVRFDPFDAATAYAFAKGCWVRCISEYYTHFSGRSQREIMLATQELSMRNKRHNLQFTITARKLADFLSSLEAEEILLEQRLKDHQIKNVHTTIEGSQENKTAVDIPTKDKQEKPSSSSPKSEDKLVIYEDY